MGKLRLSFDSCSLSRPKSSDVLRLERTLRSRVWSSNDIILWVNPTAVIARCDPLSQAFLASPVNAIFFTHNKAFRITCSA